MHAQRLHADFDSEHLYTGLYTVIMRVKSTARVSIARESGVLMEALSSVDHRSGEREFQTLRSYLVLEKNDTFPERDGRKMIT